MKKTIIGSLVFVSSVALAQTTQPNPSANTQISQQPTHLQQQPAANPPSGTSTTTGGAFGSSGASAPGTANMMNNMNATMDRQAVTRVQDQLRSQSGTVQNVTVSTANGQLVLSGTVSSEAERARIFDMARAQAGSMPVRNEMLIRRE